MRLKLLAAAAALALGACMHMQEAEAPAPELGAEEAADSCGAGEFQSLVGQPEAAVPASSLPQGTRVICHECAVTMDYREGRLNFWIDAEGKVARVTCG